MQTTIYELWKKYPGASWKFEWVGGGTIFAVDTFEPCKTEEELKEKLKHYNIFEKVNFDPSVQLFESENKVSISVIVR